MTEPSVAAQAALDEIARQRRVVDQMSTMHSLMRDRTRLQGILLLCLLLVASVVATAFAFAGGPAVVEIFGVRAARSTWLGWFAVMTFSLTLIDLVVDRRGAAREYADSVRQLARLKADYRVDPHTVDAVAECRRLSLRYQAVMDALPPLPERQFLRLKAIHLQKVEVSRYLSEHPGMSARKARRAVQEAASR